MDALQTSIWIKDLEGKIVYVNKYKAESSNLHQIDFLGKYDRQFLDEKNYDFFHDIDEEVIDTKTSKLFEEEIGENNLINLYETFKGPILDKNGVVKFTVGISNNITIIRKIVDESIAIKNMITQIKNMISKRNDILEDDNILGEIVKDLFEFLKADSMAIYVYDNNTCKLEERINLGKKVEIGNNKLLYLSKQKIEEVKNDGKYEAIKCIEKIESPLIKDMMIKNNINALGCYKIMFNDELIGFLTIKYIDENKVKVIMDDFIKAICSYIGLHIINQDLAQDVSFEIDKRVKSEKELEAKIKIENFKNDFFANVSHEFKTPLNIILGSIQLITRNIKLENLPSDIESKYMNYIKPVKQNSYRLLRLVNNLIDMSKIDGGFYKLQLGNYDIVSIVENITLSVAQYIDDKGINLIFDTDCEEQIIACDPDKIERIILNLLSNAIKCTDNNGHIFVSLNINSEKVIISIEDSGIGLSLVKSLVELHPF